MKNKLYLIIILFILLPFCKTNEDIPDLQANVEILKFIAEPSAIQRGDSSVLTWETKNAGEVSISNIGTVTASGSLEVFPFFDTEYTLTAENDVSIQSMELTITVSVDPPPPPSERAEILKFKSDKSEVPIYMEAIISWKTANAVSVYIDDLGNVGQSGNAKVNPQYTKTYYITAKGSDGVKVTAKLTINVDRVSACQGLGIYEYQGYSDGVNVTVGKNKSKYYSAYNVKVQVKLFDMLDNVIEQKTGIVLTVPPDGYGDVTIPMAEWGHQTRSEFKIIECNCDLTK